MAENAAVSAIFLALQTIGMEQRGLQGEWPLERTAHEQAMGMEQRGLQGVQPSCHLRRQRPAGCARSHGLGHRCHVAWQRDMP